MAEAASMRALESLNVQKAPATLHPVQRAAFLSSLLHPLTVDFKSNCKTFRWRKLAKLLGRIREYQRQLYAGRSPQHLLQNIKRTWPNSLAFSADWTINEQRVEDEMQAVAEVCQAAEARHLEAEHAGRGGREATEMVEQSCQCCFAFSLV